MLCPCVAGVHEGIAMQVSVLLCRLLALCIEASTCQAPEVPHILVTWHPYYSFEFHNMASCGCCSIRALRTEVLNHVALPAGAHAASSPC